MVDSKGNLYGTANHGGSPSENGAHFPYTRPYPIEP
jgi:hypothetical protein